MCVYTPIQQRYLFCVLCCSFITVTQDALTSIVVFKVQDIKEKSQDYLSTARDLQNGWYVFGVRRRVVSCRVEL